MGIAFAFLLGVANFFAQRLVFDSGHPVLASLPLPRFHQFRAISFALEFVLLAAVMLASRDGAGFWLWLYALYTLANSGAAWLIRRSA